MSRYQLLKDNEALIYQFVKNGILSYQIIRDIEIYERFQELEDVQNNQMKYIILSEEFELGVKRVEQIIYQMQRKIKS